MPSFIQYDLLDQGKHIGSLTVESVQGRRLSQVIQSDLPGNMRQVVDRKHFENPAAEIESRLSGYAKALVVRIAKTWDSGKRKGDMENLVRHNYGDEYDFKEPDWMSYPSR